MDTKRMPTHRKGAERKKIKKLGRSSGHQAKTTADSPEGSGEKRKKKRKEELGRSSGRQRNPVVTLTMTSMLDEIPASIHLRDPEIESDHLPPTNKAH